MSNETKNEISGILLAGGKARRMGGINKGAQLLGGRTLAGLVIERMEPQVNSIFISSNDFAAEFDSYGYPVFKDVRQNYPGPLAGIETILKQDLGGPWYFVSPTDTPFLPRNLAELLHKAAKEKQALCVFPTHKGKKEPLHCLLHKDVLPSLTSFLDSNKRSVLGFLEHLGAFELECELEEDDFRNLNTLEELELLNKTLEQELSDGS